MRYLIILFVLLTGCSHNITLYPRGGGEQASGTLNNGSFNMAVYLRGDTYTGKYSLGRTIGVGVTPMRPAAGPAIMVGNNSQASALLTGSKGVLRCDFTIIGGIGGNGICTDSQDVTYDMLIK